jgi:hypothetical protein
VTWLKLDDNLDGHPKVLELSEVESWRWVRALLYCSRHETDGRVPAPVLRGLKLKVARLLELGLLEERDGELFVHDFLKYNPSRAQLEGDRKRWREHKAAKRSAANVHGGLHGGLPRESRGMSTVESPVPTRKEQNHRSAGSPQAGELERATELGVGRLFALLEGLTSSQAEHIRGLALRSSGLELERLTREVGAGVVDPLAYVLERLGRMAA